MASMVQGTQRLRLWIQPGLHHLENEKVVAFHLGVIQEPAFEAGGTLTDERSTDPTGGTRGQAEGLEFVDRTAGTVAAIHHCLGELDGGNVDDALPAGTQQLEAVVSYNFV